MARGGKHAGRAIGVDKIKIKELQQYRDLISFGLRWSQLAACRIGKLVNVIEFLSWIMIEPLCLVTFA